MNPLPVAIVPPSLFSQVTLSGSVTPVILQVRVAADRETTSYPAIVTSENDSLLNKLIRVGGVFASNHEVAGSSPVVQH